MNSSLKKTYKPSWIKTMWFGVFDYVLYSLFVGIIIGPIQQNLITTLFIMYL